MLPWMAFLAPLLLLPNFSPCTRAAPTSSSKAAVATPVPLVVPPSQACDGNDGPPTWRHIQTNLGVSANALYGNDTIALGLPGDTSPSLPSQNVGGIASKEFFMGSFGLNSAATNFSTFNDPVASYMSNLKVLNQIPSLSCIPTSFENAFGINYDETFEVYLVNDTLHLELLAQAANVTFSLTNATANTFVDIVLPYQAFDLTAEWPLVQNKSRYFPLKRAADDTQTTLGRTFLQEAYLIADYERSNLFIYQRKWDCTATQDIHREEMFQQRHLKITSHSQLQLQLLCQAALEVQGLHEMQVNEPVWAGVAGSPVEQKLQEAIDELLAQELRAREMRKKLEQSENSSVQRKSYTLDVVSPLSPMGEIEFPE